MVIFIPWDRIRKKHTKKEQTPVYDANTMSCPWTKGRFTQLQFWILLPWMLGKNTMYPPPIH